MVVAIVVILLSLVGIMGANVRAYSFGAIILLVGGFILYKRGARRASP